MPILGPPFPYTDIALKLFDGERQVLLPFLGAGVPLSGRPPRAGDRDGPALPAEEVREEVLAASGLGGRGRRFLDLALHLAYLVDGLEEDPVPPAQLLKRLEEAPLPPSADEIAQVFDHLSEYISLESAWNRLDPREGGGFDAERDEAIRLLQALGRVTGLARPADALSSITGYYQELSGRRFLWNKLKQIFENKSQVTETHQLLARAARHFTEQAPPRSAYLILTTNYDCLMEEALDAEGVPWVVLTTRGSDGSVRYRFSDTLTGTEGLVREWEEERRVRPQPKDFVLDLQTRQSFAVVHKVHGCLNEAETLWDDSVVISDTDYVRFISRMARQAIPAAVSSLMHGKVFLFLGYSLRDWNVRGIFEQFVESRKRGFPGPQESPGGAGAQLPAEGLERDLSIVYSVSRFEQAFFDHYPDLNVLPVDLTEFARGVAKHEPPVEAADVGA